MDVEPEAELLRQQLVELRKELASLRPIRRDLQAKEHAAKEAERARTRRETAAAKEAELSLTQRELQRLQKLVKLYQIFGLEVETTEEGVSATFHQWHHGIRAEKYSVALCRPGPDQLQVVCHSLPHGAVSWLSEVPCDVPGKPSVSQLLREIRKSCLHWSHRHHQLQQFLVRHPNIEVAFPMSLETILIKPRVQDSVSKMWITFDLLLTYKQDASYPSHIRVTCDQNRSKESDKALEEQMTQQCEPVKNMDLTDAFYFFSARDDSTRRRTFLLE